VNLAIRRDLKKLRISEEDYPKFIFLFRRKKIKYSGMEGRIGGRMTVDVIFTVFLKPV